MADNPDVNKGQEFLSRSFIKNQAANKENSPLTNALSKNVNVFGGLAKQLTILNQNLNKMLTKPTEKKKDFVRREDPMKKLYLAVDDLEELMRESVNLQKEKEKKSKGLFGWVGALMGIGGLLGYFLTGKTEMLFSVIKSITKYSPVKFLLGFVDDIIKKIAPKLFSGIGKMFTGIGDLIMKIPGVQKIGTFFSTKLIKPITDIGKNFSDKLIKPVVEVGAKVVKPVMGIFKGIGKIFEPLGKLFGGALAKEGAKAGAKGVGKSVLKKIPVVGGLIGLFFGIQRFKKGDIVGGMLEIASGIASVIPIAGTAIGIGIDAFLLFRDFTTPKGETPPQPNWGKMGTEALKAIPGVGTFIHFKEAMGLWKTDKLGAMKEIALGLTSVVPGANLILGPVLGFIEGFIKDKGGIGEVAGKALQTAGEVIRHPVQNAGKLVSAVGGAIKGVTSKAVASVKEMPMKAASAALEASQSYYKASENFLHESPGVVGSEKDAAEKGDGWFTFAKWRPNIRGLKSKVWSKFQDMAKEYKEKTGKSIQINSAFRDQKNSIHSKGYAIDIQSNNANELESMGLMEKYGFHRPLLPGLNETWHIEPYPGSKYGQRNTNNYAIRSGVSRGTADFEIGGDNLPQITIADRANTSSKEKLELADSTIQALAQAMGTSFKGSWPTQKPGRVSIDANMRG